jgi:hypothetical protein
VGIFGKLFTHYSATIMYGTPDNEFTFLLGLQKRFAFFLGFEKRLNMVSVSTDELKVGDLEASPLNGGSK